MGGGGGTGTEEAHEGPARERRSKRTEGAREKRWWSARPRWRRELRCWKTEVEEKEKARLFFLGGIRMQMRPVFQDLARRLREACEAGDAGAVRDLVGAKADVNERDVVQYCQS